MHNSVRKNLREAKCEYIKKLLDPSLSSKKQWHNLNRVLYPNQKKKHLSIALASPSGSITDPLEVANTFNKFFVSIPITIAAQIKVDPPNPTGSIDQGSPVPNASLLNPPSFSLAPVNIDDIHQIISQLKSTLPGLDKISPEILKLAVDVISVPLC